MVIALSPSVHITLHAAERFLERIIREDEINDTEVAIEVIKNIVTRRALRYTRIDKNTLRIQFRNAYFVYYIDEKTIVTAYESEDQGNDTVEWRYEFSVNLFFRGAISKKNRNSLIDKGIIPIQKKGRLIIGQNGNRTYQFDPINNVISPVD